MGVYFTPFSFLYPYEVWNISTDICSNSPVDTLHTMCHTNILQCWYDCCQKYDMAYTAKRWKLIWGDVDLHPLRGESESISLSFIKMQKNKPFKNAHRILRLCTEILPGFFQQSVYGVFCLLLRRVNMPETSPEHRLRLLEMLQGECLGKALESCPWAWFPQGAWRMKAFTGVTAFIGAKAFSLISATKVT